VTTYRREAFQPEELAILGSAFDQIWSAVGAELGAIDPERKVAARTRLANIIVLLAKVGEFNAEEMKATSVRIFRSIEKPGNVNAERWVHDYDSSSAERAIQQKASSSGCGT